MTIGERIKSIRESKGMTQNTLADMIHVSPSYISRIENSSSNLSIAYVCTIADALGVTPQDILRDIFIPSDSVTTSEKIKIIVEQFPQRNQELLLETLEFLSSRLK
ncbi:helix-turn-helix domain-containing protein [Mediterraneibacter agrestimuris]|uniref:helix-turn-helix domain-containing protein n=1 Tax=Mediterraneibacter agrestimuris TaxID=2941333 RepID=UPI0020414D2F|nr:helix-turn-helix transcriptional regulator [Mediterraneibacter agrestimuris]